MNQEVDRLAKIIWDYHKLNHEIAKCDCILALGSHDIRIADRAAELFLGGFAPIVMFSGGIGRLTQGVFNKPEADLFAERAIELGVPMDKIIIENRSTNTGENIQFSRELLNQKGLDPQSFIIVQKPYMERRSYATFKKVWPNKEIVVTSPQLAYEEYPNEIITKDDIINIMVGDLQRIKLYPEKGYQIYQEIPPEVWSAYKKLVELGHNKHLIKD